VRARAGPASGTEWALGIAARSREQLRTAHEMFSRIGAREFAERARHELCATGETACKCAAAAANQELAAQEAQIARMTLASCAGHWRMRARPGPRDSACEAASRARSRGSCRGCRRPAARTCLLGVSMLPYSPGRHRVVIAGAGFAGYNAARELSRVAGASTEITVINPAGYFLYLPLLPQVGAGLVEPRHIGISLLKMPGPHARAGRIGGGGSQAFPADRVRSGDGLVHGLSGFIRDQ
jgi:hypothetical protein